MKFAVINTGGKQYKVTTGQSLKIEKLNSTEGEKVVFDKVLLSVDEDKVEIGQPVLNRKVEASVVSQGKGPKVRVVKYKPKVRYHKVYGHRQPFTEIKIEKI